MSELIDGVFASALAGEPPLRLTVDAACASGRRRAYRQRALLVVALSLAVAATTATAAIAVPAYRSAPPFPGGPVSASASPSRTTVPPALALEIPHCDGDGTAINLPDPDGSVLPDPHAAAAAVLASAPGIAPGRTLKLVDAERVDTSAKAPNQPRVYLIFNVVTDAGVGSLNMDILPQTDASPAQRAEKDLAGRRYSNCIPAVRTDFRDGSVGLAYTAFGTGDPSDTVQHVYYYATGMDVDAGLFLEEWLMTEGQPRAYPRTLTMPLTPDEVLAICRIVVATR